MKNLLPLFYWGRKAAENPDETFTVFGILLALVLWAIQIAISAAIVALIVAGIAKFFGKDFEEWAKGTFAVWVVIMVLANIGSCLS